MTAADVDRSSILMNQTLPYEADIITNTSDHHHPSPIMPIRLTKDDVWFLVTIVALNLPQYVLDYISMAMLYISAPLMARAHSADAPPFFEGTFLQELT